MIGIQTLPNFEGLGELAIVIYRVPQVLVPQQFLILAIYIYMIGMQTLPNFDGLGELAIVIYRVPQVLVPQQFLILAIYIFMIGLQTLANFEGLGELCDSHISCAPGPCSSTVSYSCDLYLYDWHTNVSQF